MSAADEPGSGKGALPPVLPVFPLIGAVLLPGARLPLHIFEPRYRNMVRDALAGGKLIGMIQPREPGAGEEDAETALYAVGCAGEIEQWQRLPDGRYVVILEGKSRFRAERELEERDGYRRLAVRYDEFAGDRETHEDELEAACLDDLLARLRALAARHDIEVEVDRMGQLSATMLVSTLAMGLPFAPAEKQALLEAPTVRDRYQTLTSLLDMGIDLRGRPDAGGRQAH